MLDDSNPNQQPNRLKRRKKPNQLNKLNRLNRREKPDKPKRVEKRNYACLTSGRQNIQQETIMKVSDLTTEELKNLIREAVDEKFSELLFDPDDGLELREDIEERLKTSLTSKERIPLEEVKKRVGLS